MDDICDQEITQETLSLDDKIDLEVETPSPLPQEEPNIKDVLSSESSTGQPLLNGPASRDLLDVEARTERADEGASRTSAHLNQGSPGEAECPICTEPYAPRGAHSAALLNCDHALCQSCLSTMLTRAPDCTRVRCPICRQKTPLLQWQVYSLQEDTAFHTSHTPVLTEPLEMEVHAGLCSGLEERLMLRAETTRVCGCFEYPRGLIRAIRRMQRRRRCCCVILLVMLYVVELSFLLLVFLPVLILALLFTLAR